jgi:transcription antitermination factor NusG
MAVATRARGGTLLPERFRSRESADDAAEWHVLHVKSRQEKALSRTLDGMGIAHYLPLARRIRYYGRRKAVVHEPLFPGYMFLWGSVEEAYLADRTGRVARLLRVSDQDRLEWELENIHRAHGSGAELHPHPTLREGCRVTVTSGPLKGLEGVVESRTRSDRLVLQVAMLGSAVSLEIEATLLAPAD